MRANSQALDPLSSCVTLQGPTSYVLYRHVPERCAYLPIDKRRLWGEPRPRLAWHGLSLFLPLAIPPHAPIPLGDGAREGWERGEAMLKSDLVMLLCPAPPSLPRECCVSRVRDTGSRELDFTIKTRGKVHVQSIPISYNLVPFCSPGSSTACHFQHNDASWASDNAP